MDLGSQSIKSTLYMNFSNWHFFFQKNQVVSGKTPLTLISPFCVPILFVLALAFERAVLYRNVVFSIVVLSTRKQYTNFSKKVFVFQKMFNFNVRVMKIFKISCDFRKNICQSLNWRAILKIPITAF